MKFIEKVFSVKNENNRKVIRLAGIKIKFKRKPELEYLETHLVDHCNLNCKACTHFCPLVKNKYFHNIDNFKKDIKVLSQKFRIKQLRLLGGEPLLHPRVNDFLTVARKYLPNTNISIVSNGILLTKMDESFWKTCRDNKIKIDLSQYPIILDKNYFGKYIDLVKRHNVVIGSIHHSDKFWTRMTYEGNNNKEHSYKMCTSKRCKNLRNGRLFVCPTACYADYFNEYFTEDLPVESGIDIYKNSSETIMEYLNRPVDMCKHCSVERKFFNWSKSECKKEEWFVEFY